MAVLSNTLNMRRYSTRAASLASSSSSSSISNTRQVKAARGNNKKRPKLDFTSTVSVMEPPRVSSSSSRSTSCHSSPSIFASPPEPLFNQKDSHLLLEDSFKALSRVNSERISLLTMENEVESHLALDKCEGVFRDGRPIAYFMCMSEHFNLPPDIRYRAIEIFHSFMSRHISELYHHVQLSQTSQSPISWETVEARLKHQVTLRALTCLQLASKLSLHYKIINLSRARSFLAACGFRYAPASLIQSEIRILKTLDYRIHGPTPLDFVEVLLETLGHNDPSLPIKQLHGVGIKILDVYYLSSVVLHEKLCAPKSEDLPPILELNYLLLAAGIVGAASFIMDQGRPGEILKQLSDIANISQSDITDVVAVLVEHILN